MSDRLRFLTILLFTTVAAALISRNGHILALALPLIAYLAVGILYAPSVPQLKARRSVREGVDQGTACVRLKFENVRKMLTSVTLEDEPPRQIAILEGPSQLREAIPSGGSTELVYTVRAARGVHTWNRIRVTSRDPFGLFEETNDISAPFEYLVAPKKMTLQHLPLRPQFTLHTTGSIPAGLTGPGIDFRGVREYASGDSLRWINWRMTARHPDRFFTKEFEREEIADIGLVLDARAMVDVLSETESLFELSVRSVSALAETFLREGNRVGLLIFGKPVTTLFPGYGKRQLNRIKQSLARSEASADLSIAHLPQVASRLFPRRSLLVVLSPLGPNDLMTYRQLRSWGYQVILVSPDPVKFILRSTPPDEFSLLAGRAARLERFLLMKKLLRAGVQVIDWDVLQPLDGTILAALTHDKVHRKAGT